jgi:uncharacterized protein
VRVKKYFDVLRPVLACRWIEAHGTMPPVESALLVSDQLPSVLQATVRALYERKRAGDELASDPRIPEINDFLDSEIARLGASLEGPSKSLPPDRDTLDKLFRACLAEVWTEKPVNSDRH